MVNIRGFVAIARTLEWALIDCQSCFASVEH
jgi:hypothetical protein